MRPSLSATNCNSEIILGADIVELAHQRQISAGKLFLSSITPAPADLNVMNFTTPLQAMITEEEGGGASEEIKIRETERGEDKRKRVCV